ncbi:ATP-binding protein [bacterium]|nr:ATP-binding protein [bacterium]
MEIKRIKELKMLKERLKENRVVAILGPRQCGKTTLSKQFSRNVSEEVHFFDLEDPRHLARLENPTLALENLKGFIVIDEIQRKPDLFPVLRVLVDKNSSAKYIILGSASRDLIVQSSESLAGRISYIEMGGFSTEHLSAVTDIKKLWIRGGFPRSFLAGSEQSSFQWRQDFVTTFLERDIPNLGIKIPTRTLRQFWMMLAHYHGQIFNASEIGRSLSISDNTARRYLDLLSGTFVVRQLQPWYYNTKKRIVKRPKMYFRDSGILHALLSLDNYNAVTTYPKLGASWEGFAIQQAIEHLNLKEEETFFWAVHTGAELDLVFAKKGKLWGVEVKYDEAPRLTKSMKFAMSELSLSHLWVIYPGAGNYQLDKNISAVSIEKIKNAERSFNLLSWS